MYQLIQIVKKGTSLNEIGNGKERFDLAISQGYTEIISHNSSQSFDKYNSSIMHVDSFVLTKPVATLKNKTKL
jgi:hypothetical protein